MKKAVKGGGKQHKLPTIDEFFLKERIAEARGVIHAVADQSEKPLIIQFSGGRDSVALVGLVREVTERFICCYMVSGIDFPESVEFAARMGRELGVTLLFSQPNAHKGGFFDRLAKFRRWPTVESTWCNRDLKLRPQKKVIEMNFGKGVFYKLNGVRRYESSRRKMIYGIDRFLDKDPEQPRSFRVHPLLLWTDDDVTNYLEMKGLPSSGLYKKYGVSGCYWCPFYQVDIYRSILRCEPDLYDEFIEWEVKLGAPSVIGEVYLGDLKREVVANGTQPSIASPEEEADA